MYKFLCGHIIPFLWGIYLGMELLDHVVTLCLILCTAAKLFFKKVVPFYFSTSSVWGLQCPHILSNTYCYLCFFKQIIFIIYYGKTELSKRMGGDSIYRDNRAIPY